MTTGEVKLFFEEPGGCEYTWHQVDLEQRIKWLQAHAGRAQNAAEPLSLRELARESGLGETSLSTMLARHGKKTMVPRAGQACTALSLRWKVSLDWLLNGFGEPFDGALTGLDRVLAELKWSEETVAAANARRNNGGENYSEDDWRAWMRKVEAAVRAKPGPAPETGEFATGRLGR